jgi:hypothetical protein
MKPLIIAALVLATGVAHATQRGVTEKGEEILLEDDGTWRYVQPPKDSGGAAPTAFNEKRFSRPALATFPVKSQRNKSMVYIDPKKWSFVKGKEGGDNEFSFRLTSGDLYGRFITERMSIPLETLPQVALTNSTAG